MPNRPLDDLSPQMVRDVFSEVELRTIVVPAENVEWRASDSKDGSRVFSGYASVFDQATTLYEGSRFKWLEKIDPHAFDNVLASDPDVHFNMGHDMNRSMARTKAPGPLSALTLSADAHGLRVYARLNPANRTVQELIPLMDDKVMDQMSFAFRVKSSGVQTVAFETPDGMSVEEDTILEISNLYDVCVCAQGAYPTTEAALRSLALGAHVSSREVPLAEEGAAVPNPTVSEAPDGAAVPNPTVEGTTRGALIAESLAVPFATRKDDPWIRE
jgi:HK97 family phage prohead protease